MLLVFIFCQIFLSNQSYGTENFPRLKYTLQKFEACEKCDENSKIFYEIEKNQKICPRCTLGYLSYYFASKNMEEIKFYCADILYHSISDKFKRSQHITWNVVKHLLYDQLKKQKQRLIAHKHDRIGFNLFIIMNTILEKMKQKPLEKSKCSKCSNARFHLIKLLCCQIFICNACFDDFKIKTLNCEICQKTRKIKIFLVNNILLRNIPFGRWILDPGIGVKCLNIFANCTLQYLVSPYIINFRNLFWAPFNFFYVKVIMDNGAQYFFSINSNSIFE